MESIIAPDGAGAWIQAFPIDNCRIFNGRYCKSERIRTLLAAIG
jgi:hypothetical protein